MRAACWAVSPDPSHRGCQEKPREVPMPFARLTVAMELTPGKADLVEWTGEALIRRDGVTGKRVWDTSRPRSPYDPGRDPSAWLRTIAAEPLGNSARRERRRTSTATARATCSWSFRDSTAFLALSGKDGSMLWNFTRRARRPRRAAARGPGPARPDRCRPAGRARSSACPRSATSIATESPDLIATLRLPRVPRGDRPPPPGTGRRAESASNMPRVVPRIVVAISGRSGRWLWSHPIDPAFTTSWSPPVRDNARRRWCRAGESSMVAILDGDGMVAGLDPATGRPRSGPIDLGFEPVRPLQYADLDGDGEPEILALGSGPGPRQQTLAAFSPGTGRQLWTATVESAFVPSAVRLLRIRPLWAGHRQFVVDVSTPVL